MTPNPYAPPTAELTLVSPNAATQRARRGPALYIAGFGLLGGVGAATFLPFQNLIASAPVLIGCILGGLIYRIRSRDWPHDPTIRQKQILYSVLAVVLPPVLLFLLAGPDEQRSAIVMVGLIVGVSVACGIFISGTRRLNVPLTAEQ